MADFEDETGHQVNYTEPVNDNEEYFAKIRPILAANKDVGVDSFVLTDWMASQADQPRAGSRSSTRPTSRTSTTSPRR